MATACSEPVVYFHGTSSNVLPKIKDILKIKHKVKASEWQPKSRLPMGMIVSKMATRTPAIENSEDPLPSLLDVDLSMIRKHRLTPPSWLNKPYQRQNSRPTQFENLIASMKEKRLQIESYMHGKPNSPSQRKSHTEIVKTKANIRNNDCGSDTSDLDEYCNRLYGKRQKLNENAVGTTTLDEDPMGNLATMSQVNSQTNPCCQNNTSSIRSSNEEFEFNPNCIMPQPEFKWNPIILNSPRNNSPLSWLTSDTFSETDVCEEYENSYHDQRFVRQNLLPTYELRNQFPDVFPEYETVHSLSPPPHAFKAKSYSMHGTYPTSPCSPEIWETSSTSSGQTIAEERLQLTYYTSCLPGRSKPSTEYSTNKRNSRSDRPKSTIFNFLEE